MTKNTKIDINGIEVIYISMYQRYRCLGKTFKNLIQAQNYIETHYEELIECKTRPISMEDNDMVDYDDDFTPSYDDNLTEDDYDDECDSPNENSEEDD